MPKNSLWFPFETRHARPYPGKPVIRCAYVGNAYFAVCDLDGVTVWCDLSSSPRVLFRGETGHTTSLVGHAADPVLATGGVDGSVSLWFLETARDSARATRADAEADRLARWHTKAVSALAFDKESRLWSASLDGTVGCWELDGALLRQVCQPWAAPPAPNAQFPPLRGALYTGTALLVWGESGLFQLDSTRDDVSGAALGTRGVQVFGVSAGKSVTCFQTSNGVEVLHPRLMHPCVMATEKACAVVLQADEKAFVTVHPTSGLAKTWVFGDSGLPSQTFNQNAATASLRARDPYPRAHPSRPLVLGATLEGRPALLSLDTGVVESVRGLSHTVHRVEWAADGGACAAVSSRGDVTFFGPAAPAVPPATPDVIVIDDDQARAERDQAYAERDRAFAERDRAFADRQQAAKRVHTALQETLEVLNGWSARSPA